MRTSPKPTTRRIAGTLLALLLPTTLQAAPTQPICVDAVNRQYFYYDGKTIPLVGYSAEYICHIDQTGATDICDYGNYPQVLQAMADQGLNRIRIWAGLNHSPGGAAGPLPFEQPFKYMGGGKWDLTVYEDTWFNRLREVVAFAQLKGIIVEITLFDAFSPNFAQSPWKDGNNTNGIVGFTKAEELTSLPPGVTACTAFDTGIRFRQRAFMKEVIRRLNEYHNVYYEMANEPDMAVVAGLSDAQVVAWHNCMVRVLRNTEGTPSAPQRHLVAVNYHSDVAMNSILTNSDPVAVPAMKILTGHYVRLRDGGRRSGLENIQYYLGDPMVGLDRIFGFNEGRPTPNYYGSFFISSDAVRAEAWEFMLNEGGIYDHLGYDWDDAGEPTTVRTQLGRLLTFLKGLPLRKMARTLTFGSPPSWAPTLPSYGSLRGTSNVYWSAMQDAANTYVLYLHHSTLSTHSFKAYVKPASITRLTTLDLKLGLGAASYTAQWINPSTGAVIGSSFSIPADGVQRTYTVPSYTYDLALKITNGNVAVPAGTCAP